MQIVNGCICMNCCDWDKARLGQDPHQSADHLKKQSEQRLDKSSPENFGPAVTFCGALLTNGANGGSDASGSPPATATA
jgi:hypothetical protein